MVDCFFWNVSVHNRAGLKLKVNVIIDTEVGSNISLYIW